MHIVGTPDELDKVKARAVLVMYGSQGCGVCIAIRPRIEALLAQHFPELEMAYVSCEDHPELCAQHGVFSLPALKLFLGGKISLELARSFSLKELQAGIERSYVAWRDARSSYPFA